MIARNEKIQEEDIASVVAKIEVFRCGSDFIWTVFVKALTSNEWKVDRSSREPSYALAAIKARKRAESITGERW